MRETIDAPRCVTITQQIVPLMLGKTLVYEQSAIKLQKSNFDKILLLPLLIYIIHRVHE